MEEMIASLKGIASNVEVLAQSAEESSSSILEMAATNDYVLPQLEGGVLGERPGHQSARTSLRVPATRNQAGTFQNAQVFRNRGLGHIEGLRQFGHRRFPGRETRKNGASRWVCQRGKRCVETRHTGS